MLKRILSVVQDFPRKVLISTLAATISFSAAASDSAVSLTIDPKAPVSVINKDVYGQFAEHLGRGIYEGVWVGKDSKIPNTNGFRNDVIKALKELKVPLVRWPGGCFADEYQWREGIGDPKKRPVKVNTHWGGVEENNRFGTHEFFEFAEMIGADTYVNGNLGTGTPREMAEWLEYMTSDKNSTLANLRRKNGRDKPFKVDYFGIGNEAWGCGGTMRPEYYADLYRHYATFLKTPQGATPKFVASGGHSGETLWTDVLSTNIKQKIDGISYHYYTLPTGDWGKKGAAVGFPEKDWFSTFEYSLRIDGYIGKNIAVLEKNDPEGKVGLYVDEWGTWYDPEEGRDPGFLYQQNTIRDALIAAVNFNIFHKYADRVRMTNIAQMVNVLQAMILTDGEKMVMTPTYYAYKLYQPFQGATTVSTKTEGSALYTYSGDSIDAFSSSAAIGSDGNLYVSLVNIATKDAVPVSLDVLGKNIANITGERLAAKVMDARNSFDQPNALTPTTVTVAHDKDGINISLPPMSVTVLKVVTD